MFIKRDKLSDLREHLDKKEISLIVGPRQAGKTTLMKELEKELVQKKQKTIFLSLDFEKDRPFFNSQELLIKKLELEFGDSKGYIFIDEIQRKENAGLFLKGLYDMDLNYKFIVSGSGSLELKEKIHESLAGRKRVFELSTVSFREFVNFNTNYVYENRLDDFFVIEKERVDLLFMDYFNFGGYPRVVTEKTFFEKLKIIDEIYQSYIEKDISYLLKIEKTETFNSLIKILAGQIGNLLNYSELSNTLNISMQTVKKYLWYAEKTFIIQRVSPFFKNTRKEIIKSPVAYFNDLGLKNYSLGLMGNITKDSDAGFLFENFIYLILQEKINFYYRGEFSIHFWRTKDKAEVDFIIESGNNITPIEVKYKEFKKAKIERSMRNFIKKYKPKKAFIVNKNLSDTFKIDETEAVFVPYNEFIKKSFKLIEY